MRGTARAKSQMTRGETAGRAFIKVFSLGGSRGIDTTGDRRKRAGEKKLPASAQFQFAAPPIRITFQHSSLNGKQRLDPCVNKLVWIVPAVITRLVPTTPALIANTNQ